MPTLLPIGGVGLPRRFRRPLKLAARQVVTGKVTGAGKPRHLHQEFLAFPQAGRPRQPSGKFKHGPLDPPELFALWSTPGYLPAVGSEPSAREIQWSQPFRWGLLTAFDSERSWDLPDDVNANAVTATDTALAVQVLHSQDIEEPEDWPSDLSLPEAQVRVVVAFAESPDGAPVEFDGLLQCRSGRLAVGDAESERILDVPAGVLRIQVSLFPREFAEYVVLRLIQAE